MDILPPLSDSGGKALTPFPPHIQASMNPRVLRAGSWASPLSSPPRGVHHPPPLPRLHIFAPTMTPISLEPQPLPRVPDSSPVISFVPFPGCPLPPTRSHTGLNISPSCVPISGMSYFLGPLGGHWAGTHLLPNAPSGSPTLTLEERDVRCWLCIPRHTADIIFLPSYPRDCAPCFWSQLEYLGGHW